MSSKYLSRRRAIHMDGLVDNLREHFGAVPDHRGSNASHKLVDVLTSAFAMFSLKYPSLLRFEQHTATEGENLKRLFKLPKICSDAQMRTILDKIPPDLIHQAFPQQLDLVEKLGFFREYRFLDKYLLLSIDGVEFFRSKKIHCDQCLTQHHRNGEISYSHSMLAAVLVHPYRKEVFPLGCEAIQKQDGQGKNDCELNASKRLQTRLLDDYKGPPFIIVEDALYANEPHIQQIIDNQWDFIISVKPSGNPNIFKYFEARKAAKNINKWIIKKDNKEHHFYWINNAPLNSGSSLRANFLYYEEHSPNGQIQKFSWITSIKLSKAKLYSLMRGARARWKIENETFNTLKNQGYHFEHNYGHGYQHLCNVLALIMLLAFFIDQLIQACNVTFQKVWQAAKYKSRIWEAMRAFFLTTPLKSFNELWIKIALMFEVQLE